MRTSGIIFYLIFTCIAIQAQNIRNENSDSISSIARLTAAQTTIKRFTIRDRDSHKNIDDTLFTDFEKYDPAKRFETASLGIGNIGSAQQAVRLQQRLGINTVAGFHQYDIYKLDPDDLSFYEQNRPYNDLFFSPVAGQNNFVVGAQFSRDFANDVNVTLDFKRYTQEGFYQNQKTKSTALGFGLWKSNPDKNHDLFIRFVGNNHNEEVNGGVATDTLFDQELFRLRTAIPVRLSGDTMRHQHFNYIMDNYFDAVKDRLSMHHQIEFETGYFRYGDDITNTANDSLVYGDFLVDNRGLRYYMGFTRINNAFDLGWKQKVLGVKMGIRHSYQRYTPSNESLTVNDLTVWGALNLNIGNFTSFNGNLDLGVGDNAGNLELKAMIQLDAIQDFKINGFVHIHRYDPSLIQQSLIITEQLIYNNAFAKINDFELGGSLFWEKANLNLKFKSGVRDQAIAYDNRALPYQIDGSIEFLQAELDHRFEWRFIGMENSILYQTFSDNIFNLPKLYSIHNLYIQFRLFKRRLLTQTGILYYNIDYDGGLAYMPLNGAFYPIAQEAQRYHYTEFYANFKVDRFRMFFKIDNFTELWNREVHYQIYNYPQFDYKIRIGVRWQMYD
ncbi:MAG: hypothetical protein HKN09_06625 [Saprospiraceae bacterium]|nr:hypothetical protein [Saprospiraceae bacterium]